MASRTEKGTPLSTIQIENIEKLRRQSRERLTLYKRPIQTLYIFASALCNYSMVGIKYCIMHPTFLYIFLPIFSIYGVIESFPQNPLAAFIDKLEFYVEFFMWWVGLGVLSSIGLGSGLQSGVLFLFPHIIKVCLAAQTCETLDFDSMSNMWFRSPPNLFRCPDTSVDATPVTFFGLWMKVILVCFLQSAGTAIGEIPPYWFTRAARMAGIEAGTSDASDIPEELDSSSDTGIFNRTKAWMIRLLRNHGFYGVLLMASFPNILFDVCGICCGHYLMPFWTFFGATFLGKAIIRNSYQSIIYVTLCRESYLEFLIQLLQRLAPDSLKIDAIIREVLEEGRDSFRNPKNGAGDAPMKQPRQVSIGRSYAEVAMLVWQLVMTSFLLTFLLSCISQFAQYYQLTLDNEEIAKLKAKAVSVAASKASSEYSKVSVTPSRQQVTANHPSSPGAVAVSPQEEPSMQAAPKSEPAESTGILVDLSKKME